VKELHCPTYLQPYVDGMRSELGAVLYPIHLRTEVRMLSPAEIADSLLSFADRVNQNGLDQTLKPFAKSDDSL